MNYAATFWYRHDGSLEVKHLTFAARSKTAANREAKEYAKAHDMRLVQLRTEQAASGFQSPR